MAGLACAQRLAQQGAEVTLFDKGRWPGGRLSSLVTDLGEWDFGAQFLSARGSAFAAQLAAWRAEGMVAPWPAGPDGALVGVPRMESLIAALCRDFDVHFAAQVQRIDRRSGHWFLTGADLQAGPFDALVIAIPAEQAAALAGLHDLDMARELAAIRSRPCWTAMAAFAAPLAELPDWLQHRGGLAWAARNNSKPARPPAECWVIQASADWSQAHLELDKAAAAPLLLDLFAAETGCVLPEPVFLKAHRWRFAAPYGQSGRVLWNPRLNLGACGDWSIAGQIEGAWLAGQSLADQALASLAPDHSRAAG